MSAKQTIVITRVKTRTRKKKTNNSSGKRGNPNRCPSCGRFM